MLARTTCSQRLRPNFLFPDYLFSLIFCGDPGTKKWAYTLSHKLYFLFLLFGPDWVNFCVLSGPIKERKTVCEWQESREAVIFSPLTSNLWVFVLVSEKMDSCHLSHYPFSDSQANSKFLFPWFLAWRRKGNEKDKVVGGVLFFIYLCGRTNVFMTLYAPT